MPWLETRTVGRTPQIPNRLTKGPFTRADATHAGVRRWNLEGASWRRIGPRTYMSSRIDRTPLVELEAAWRRVPPLAAFSGLTAAWLHGLDVTPRDPIDVTIPKGLGVSGRAGMRVTRAALAKGEVVKLRGFRATSMFRTLLDISGRLALTEAVVVADMAMHAHLITPVALNRSLAMSSGAKGVRALRRVASLAEPASESPMETRLRLLLVAAGLPRPEAQVPIHDRLGRFVGRPDLYYRANRLGIEYDGSTHRSSLAEDNRRQNRLLDAGVRLLRFAASDIFNAPESVVALVRAMLVDSTHAPALGGLALRNYPQVHALADSRGASPATRV
jgi:very-short-patch-repair endonuclease